MRLTEKEIYQIKHYVYDIFGEKSRVYLFGSRVDDLKKGGDIDLFIEAEKIKDEVTQKATLWAKLQFALGEQKIDIILARDSSRLIEQEARESGQLL